MIKKNDEGTQPLYRNKNWNVRERREQKRSKKKEWYTRDGSEAVFFVETTPDGILAEACKKSFKKAGLKVKVVERTGKTVKTALTKSNPFRKNGCNIPTCEVCSLNAGVHCKTREVLYKISCTGENGNQEPCSNVSYIGETSRSILERFKEHHKKMMHQKDSERKKSFMYDHANEAHGGNMPSVSLEIIGRFTGDAGARQAAEAVCIREEKPQLNGKDEWTNQPRRRRDDI